jgi:hypothetical protein
MQFNDKEYKVFEIYSLFSKEGNKENDTLVEEAFIHQNIDCSRIAFKEYRDELVRCHLGYAVEEHDGVVGEDDLGKELYGIDRLGKEGKLDYAIGRVVDYQVPVKRCSDDCECDMDISNIDLITETATSLNLINIIDRDSNQSLLRNVMEIITYRNMISRTKLISDFSVAESNILKYYHTKDDLTPAVLLFENSQAHNDLKELKPDTLIGHLISKYNVHIFVVKDQDKGIYELVE